MLLSSEVNAKFNGWGDYDSKFWEPLLTQPLPQLKNQNFGQIVHAFFPNIKYVTCLNVPPPRRIPTVKTTLTTLTTYVSDQNLIQPQDTTAFRKMIFDMLGEYRHGKNVPRKFTDLDKAPKFRADRLNIPDFSTTLHVVKEALSIEHHLVVSEKRRRQVEPTFRIIGAFDPFRNVLTLTVDDIRLEINLMTTTEPEVMKMVMGSKVLALLLMTRRMLGENGSSSPVRGLRWHWTPISRQTGYRTSRMALSSSTSSDGCRM
jgi:hypothetical protein